MRAKDRWLRYRQRPCRRELEVGEVAQIVWPLILKAARLSEVQGSIPFLPVVGPVSGLLRHTGGRLNNEGRHYAIALRELSQAGLIRIEPAAIVVVNWNEHLPSREKKGDFEFVKLWASDSHSFSELPPMCRGIAHLLLRIADEDGVLPSKVDRIRDRLGWQTYRRPHLDGDGGVVKSRRYIFEEGHVARWLEMLFDDGYLVLEGNAARIRNFTEFQAPEPRGDHGGSTVASRSHHGGDTVGARRPHGEKEANPLESFNTGVRDQRRREEIREDPPFPPQNPRIDEPEGGGVFCENGEAKPEPQSHEAPEGVAENQPGKSPLAFAENLPADRPAWYREICAAFGPVDGELAAWAEAQKAARIAGSGETLAAFALERLPWQRKLNRWRKSGGQYVPSLANYFARGHWRDSKPADPAAFADPPETPAEKKAKREAIRAAAIARQQQEAAAAAKDSHADRLRSFWGSIPEARAYRPPADPEARAVAEAVLASRLEQFRAEHPGADLPPLFASFAELATADRGDGSDGSDKTAPPIPLARPLDTFGKAISELRFQARRCERLDREIRAVEEITGAANP